MVSPSSGDPLARLEAFVEALEQGSTLPPPNLLPTLTELTQLAECLLQDKDPQAPIAVLGRRVVANAKRALWRAEVEQRVRVHRESRT